MLSETFLVAKIITTGTPNSCYLNYMLLGGLSNNTRWKKT